MQPPKPAHPQQPNNTRDQRLKTLIMLNILASYKAESAKIARESGDFTDNRGCPKEKSAAL
jgi:hypothetical protein